MAATAFFHKLQNGIHPRVPCKGHENKTYKQVQEEAIESKRRDLAVPEANGGVWPGIRTPTHSLFIWAWGSEPSSVMEDDQMPTKYFPKVFRYNTNVLAVLVKCLQGNICAKVL